MQTRRDTLLTFGALWTALAIPAAAAAQATPALGWSPKALSADQARRLEVVAELIMPASDTPGAREAGVPAFIDRNLAEWSGAAQRDAVKAGLDRIDADARAAHGQPFLALAPAQQAALLARYDGEARAQRGHFFGVLKDLTTVGYFTSEAGATKAARYDPVPGDYKGCVPLKEIGRVWAL
ncbi:MAG: gluconate 2-dehydrogenase subunit 3 family protein [Phenylobacterium sp.]|uniref:gluconate 2-dehydrogenase subunit 3 family protein n=1 Tax=Phenylobacterium sp. TaxID=1871053 RepID=UPI001A499324|nr:gluconate 2-dehydrogenase subunit 3 family protein [Phenylobacterium sp.]MBL8556584.1 gluconate 2-dehydrogenase subunit 3 family protein [Phenylobacterium sp.]